MANKYMKKCLSPLAIKDMQVKTILRFHLTPDRMAITNKMTTDAGKDAEKKEKLYIFSGNVNEYSHYGNYSKKVKVELHDPSIPLLGRYPKECKSAYNRDLYTHAYCSTIHNSQVIK
jgi:hypothetical protein